jgi:hypothetical protein
MVLVSALGAVWTWVPGAQAALPHRYAAGQPTYLRLDARLADGAALRAACGSFATGRVLAPRETWLGVPLLADLPTPQGYPESLAPRYTSALLDGAGLAPHSVFPLDRRRLARAGGALRLLDVQCIVLPADWEALVAGLGFTRAGVLGDGRVVSVRAGAAAFLPPEVVGVASDDAALAAVLAPGFAPERVAIVRGTDRVPRGGPGRVEHVHRLAPGRLAAHRAGLRDVILPRGNERDLRDVPDDVREGIEFHFVDRMDEVVELALFNGKETRAARAGRSSRQRGARAARRKDD